MRKSKEEIEAIKESCDIRKLLQCLEVNTLVIAGDMARGRCPFPSHADRTPSFCMKMESVDDYQKGRWICSSECGSGDVVSFVMRMSGRNFYSSLQFLQDFLSHPQGMIGAMMSTDFLREKKEDDPLAGTFDDIAPARQFFAMRNGLSAMPYLVLARHYPEDEAKRVCFEFGLGISMQKQLGWVVVPVHDSRGSLCGVQLTEPVVCKSRKYNPPGSDCDRLFNLHRTSGDFVVLVESVWCAMRLHHWGISAVSTFGARFSRRQGALLRNRFSVVFAMFDNDVAGMRADAAVSRELVPSVDLFKVKLPPGQDADKSNRESVVSAIKAAEKVFF